ncbi:MAG: hypothetical protein IPM32_01910 [Ignavibacteriae bacterium]|nr:hypothetical protein [Ignavibacteriota bacterium]
MKNVFIIFLVLVFNSAEFNSQIKIHKTFSVRNGLVDNEVRNIFQDSKGYLWFATNNGVSRWDGNNFYNLTKFDGLTSSAVFDITEGNDGTIYFANFGVYGITTFNDGKIDTILNTPNNKVDFVSVIHANKDGSLILGASQGIYLFKNNVLLNLNEMNNIPASPIHKKLISDENLIYFASSNGILEYSNNQLKSIVNEKHVNDPFFSAIGKNKNGELYFGGSGKLYSFNNGEIKSFVPNKKILNIDLNDIYFSKISDVGYFSTDLGLGILSQGKIELLTTQNGLTFNRGWVVYESNLGDLFVSNGLDGFQIYEPNKIENYNSQNGLPDNNVFNFFQANNGIKFINTYGGLLVENNISSKIYETPEFQNYNIRLSFIESKNGNIYIGSRLGIDIFKNNKIQSLIKFKGTIDVHSEGSNYVFALAETKNGEIFAGTYKGVYKITNDEIKLITKSDGLKSNYVQAVISTKNNSIIFGYHNSGIDIYSNGNFKNFSMLNGLSDNSILDLYETQNGKILIATQNGGLNIFNNNKIEIFKTKNGLLSNEIRAVAEDEFGNIYLTSPKGFNILTFSENNYLIRSFNEEDGLIGNDCNVGALFVDENNNVFIGTKNGLSKYNPNFDKLNKIPPPVYINGVEIFNQPQNLKKFKQDPQLNYDQNYLKFSYVGINLSAPHKIIYKYKLSGVDIDWVESNVNSVQYTSLDDGNYIFEVKAKNEWGYWSEPTQLSFVINPAWWETWWFYSLSFIAIGSLIAFISSYRYRHLLAIEKMRSKISADLHDSVGSGLSEISILTELLKYQVPEEKQELKSGLGNVSTISRTLVESMGDIVWLVNPKKDSLKDLFKRLQLSYHEVLKHTDTDLFVENLDELENIKLPMNFRQHLYLIFKEAINNAIKYSDADLLTLNIKTAGNLLTVTFSDNGKGFDLNQEKLGNGLLNMQNRAKEIGGKIEYFSEVNNGTKIIFTGKFNKQRLSFI